MTSRHSDGNGKTDVAAFSSNHLRDDKDLKQHTLTAGEVMLGGRRFRLVPVEEIQLPAHKSPASLLTARELQIVALVAEGRVNKQIASDLGISEWTVSTHLRRIFCKLGVDTRAAMVSKCASMPVKLPRD
jgi:DNA-binding CsgD family transcriptional regulator